MISKIVITALLVLVLIVPVSSVASGKEECEDIKYEDDPLEMPGSNHGDNNPSEDKLKDMIFDDNATLCEVAECHDNHECKGELEEHERDEFEDTITYQGTSEKQQKCLDKRYDLPDGGEEASQSYELFDCGVNNY